MALHRRLLQSISAAILFVLVGLTWLFLMPAKFGGQASYVIVNGISMEPSFHLGDLVIVRKQDDYKVGDAVVYFSPEMGEHIFHRIIALELDRFILQGDNNRWLDTYKPVEAEIVGKLWLRIPNLGKLAQWLQSPLHLTLAGGGLGGISMMFFLREEKKKKKSQRKTAARSHPSPASALPAVSLANVTYILASLWLASLILGIFAFIQPLQKDVPQDFAYQHYGRFNYIADAPPGIYNSDTVNPGEPIYLNLSCRLTIEYQYIFASLQQHQLIGSHALTAEISDDSGWKRTIPLTGRTEFVGDNYSTRSELNLCQVRSIVEQVEQRTGVINPQYKLAIQPSTFLSGTVAGIALEDSFTPALIFQFDNLHFWMLKDASKADPFEASQAGLARSFITQMNTLGLGSFQLPVSAVRNLAMTGVSVATIGLLGVGYSMLKASSGSEVAKVKLKYGSLIVDVQGKEIKPAARQIEVNAIEDLARLAEKTESPILYQAKGRIHSYWVQDNHTLYRYIIRETSSGMKEPALAVFEEEIRQGLKRGQFQVYYQPIVSLTDWEVVAVEALLRWNHPERGLVSASEFIPAAEETGLIDSLDEWMLRSACNQLRVWHANGQPLLSLAVNLSEKQILGNTIGHIKNVLQETSVDPHCLLVEIPEYKLMEKSEKIMPRLQDLKELGVRISIDDFRGSFPVSILGRFPGSSVKIDFHLLENISDPEKAAAARSIISVAQSLGFYVIAEGVETEEQLEFLRGQYCNAAQGYLIGRPTSGQVATRFIADTNLSINRVATGEKR